MKQSLIVYRRLLTFARPYWAGFGLALLGMVVAAATEPLLPAALKPLLDEGFVKKADFPLWWIPVSIIGIFVVRGVGTFVSSYGLNWVANKVMADMRRILFAHLLRLPAAEFEQRAAGLMISRVVFDIGNVGEAVTRVLLILIRDSLVIVGLLAYLLWLNWKLTLVAFVLIPVMGGLITLVSKRMMRLSRQSLDLVGEMTRDVEEAVHGYKVIKIFGAYERESQVFQRTVERLRGVLMRITVSAGLTTPMTQMCAAVAVSAVVSVALLQAGDGQTTVGGFASFITALLMLLSPLKHLADINGPLQRGLAAAENVFEMLDHASEPDRGSRTLSRARGEVRFEQVVFRYPGAQVDALRGITLEVKAGEVVALVGGSGGGKTTLINLLPRFFSPTSGRVLLDGVPIEELTLASLREQMALVSQDIVLFNDTVRANVAFSVAVTPPDEEIWAALRVAALEDFVRGLPEGLDTQIGERGTKMSGGQRQRLAIARAILKNAPVLLLDEATSALDTETEREVQSALDRSMEGRTTLVIAHRLSTIERADRIVVIEAGTIVEQGRHAELLAKDGAYARLHRIQYAPQSA